MLAISLLVVLVAARPDKYGSEEHSLNQHLRPEQRPGHKSVKEQRPVGPPNHDEDSYGN